MVNFRRANLTSVLGLSLVLIAAAAPATAKDFTLKGRSNATGACNAGALFRLTVSLTKGRFTEVKTFQTYGINYPNTVPEGTAGFPIPIGSPTGQCVQGDDAWQTHEWQCASETEKSCTEILALPDPSYVNEFHGFFVTRTPAGPYDESLTSEAKGVAGTVHVKRNKKSHRLKVRAEGDFIDALGGESGFESGGVSTGHVAWTASNSSKPKHKRPAG
jgi:hypothetical protein